VRNRSSSSARSSMPASRATSATSQLLRTQPRVSAEKPPSLDGASASARSRSPPWASRASTSTRSRSSDRWMSAHSLSTSTSCGVSTRIRTPRNCTMPGGSTVAIGSATRSTTTDSPPSLTCSVVNVSNERSSTTSKPAARRRPIASRRTSAIDVRPCQNRSRSRVVRCPRWNPTRAPPPVSVHGGSSGAASTAHETAAR